MPKAWKTRILLADDHPVVREGLRLLISRQSDLEVVGEAQDGRQLLSFARTLRPEIVVMDLSMPQSNAVEIATALKKAQPGLKVVILTVHEDEACLQEMAQAGAVGYVLKRSAGDELIRALRTVVSGGVYFDRTLAEKALVNRLTGLQPQNKKGCKSPPSPREEKVLRLIAWGYTNKEIAGQLNVSIKSVETYRTRICLKLGFHSRTEIVRFALRRGWLKEE